MDISALNSLSKTLSNIEIYQPKLPDYEDTVCGKMDRLNSTQESQLNELEKIKYENIKLNAQIDTLNKLTDKQSDDINTLKIDLATTQKHLDNFKKQYEDSNKHSFITGIIIGFIPALIIFILTIIATKFLSKAMKKFFTKRQVLLGNLNGTVEEMVTGYKSVVAYNRQENVIKDFNNVSDELTRVGIIAEILGGSMGPVMNVINNISFVIIAAFGGYFAINHIISIGVISAFIVYAKQFGRPIDELAQIYGQIQTAIAGAERVFAVMDEPLEDKSGDKNMDKLEGVIKFKDVNFSYTKDKQVLYDFNLQVKAGQKVALVGSTGSGKTTVVNLLMRFYDVDSGEILIDDVNIKDIDCATLRKNTAIVLQDTVLFADTIKNNLKYSNEAATDEQMYAAAAMSNCDTMINKMPLKYDTELMAEGENISQGQRQLLSIARAFLAQPKILILDEATSNVDTRTEKHIQDAMLKLMENRTSLIIAHRLSTIQDADIIVVMDEGHIVEAGNHKELLNKMGRYYKLYMTQFAGQTI